jgi:phenylpyruvate tautomerase PptA (4-oxalocrotonate tautomerase family)
LNALVRIIKMPIIHIVLFKFKEDTEPTVVKDVCEASSTFARENSY